MESTVAMKSAVLMGVGARCVAPSAQTVSHSQSSSRSSESELGGVVMVVGFAGDFGGEGSWKIAA